MVIKSATFSADATYYYLIQSFFHKMIYQMSMCFVLLWCVGFFTAIGLWLSTVIITGFEDTVTNSYIKHSWWLPELQPIMLRILIHHHMKITITVFCFFVFQIRKDHFPLTTIALAVFVGFSKRRDNLLTTHDKQIRMGTHDIAYIKLPTISL